MRLGRGYTTHTSPTLPPPHPRLQQGVYADPWDICDDVRLMWSNAWLYNKKASRIYKFTTTLSELFDKKVDVVMKRLGFCCGNRINFTPQLLYCANKPLCVIRRGDKYRQFKPEGDGPPTNYCAKCYNELPDKVTIDTTERNERTQIAIDRTSLVEKINDELIPEPMVQCSECHRRHHQICQLWHEKLGKKFVCLFCRQRGLGVREPPSAFTADKLPRTKLGDHIQERLLRVLREGRHGPVRPDQMKLTVRVVSIRDKEIKAMDQIKAYYADSGEPYPEEFKYKTKALFVWQKQKTVDLETDLCFFGLHVQEYPGTTPSPNAGRVYVSYLDSVYFFEPKGYRTAIYKELLIAYLEHCRNIGYNYAHIWACPPTQGDDYIFYQHPEGQKVPKPKRLQDWYKDMLTKAAKSGRIARWTDMNVWAREQQIGYARQLPYFDGDYWPGLIEDQIKEINTEKEEAQGGKGGKKGKKGSKSKSSKSKGGGKRPKVTLAAGQEELCDKLFETLEKHKDVFFVAYLRPQQQMLDPPVINDPDGDIINDLMDGRDGLLNLCRDNHAEFSEPRRAKHSSLLMLYHLHHADETGGQFTCNACQASMASMEYRWHCTECSDFDLCEKCYTTEKHEHKMEKLGFQAAAATQEDKKKSIQKCIEALVHASSCKAGSSCKVENCAKMQQIITHTKECKMKPPGCQTCKQLVALCCYHAKHCQLATCPVPFCSSIKQRLADKQARQRSNHDKMMARRMQQMRGVDPNGEAAGAGAGEAAQGAGAGEAAQGAAAAAASQGASDYQRKLGQVENSLLQYNEYIRRVETSRLTSPLTPEQEAKLTKAKTDREKLVKLKAKLTSAIGSSGMGGLSVEKQRAILQDIFKQLTGLSRPEQQALIKGFTNEQKRVLQLYQQQQQHKRSAQQQAAAHAGAGAQSALASVADRL